MRYYVLLPNGDSCGHVHREMNRGLARCYGGRAGHRVYRVSDTGAHDRLSGAQLAPLRAFLPTRGPGRPAGQTPRIEQASPLYARLSVAERTRFEELARERGFDDLGKWALALMRAAGEGTPLGFGAPVAPGVYSNRLNRNPMVPGHIADAIETLGRVNRAFSESILLPEDDSVATRDGGGLSAKK